jgi:hypothetical protein
VIHLYYYEQVSPPMVLLYQAIRTPIALSWNSNYRLSFNLGDLQIALLLVPSISYHRHQSSIDFQLHQYLAPLLPLPLLLPLSKALQSYLLLHLPPFFHSLLIVSKLLHSPFEYTSSMGSLAPYWQRCGSKDLHWPSLATPQVQHYPSIPQTQ